MSNLLDELLVLLKNKKVIGCLIAILIAIITMNLFIAVYRGTIREQQIESVAKTTYKNKQFKSIQEDELTKLMTSKEQVIIGIVDPVDNKGFNDIKKMFNEKSSIDGLPKTVYIYQPIYDSSKVIKNLGIKDKNTFIVVENGKELGRYSFNQLEGGYEEVINEVNQIIHPKIERKKPIRKQEEAPKTDNQEGVPSEDGTTSSGDVTHTSEVFFE